MGRQYNKILKRRRRARYLKRKKLAAKAKPVSTAPAAAPAAPPATPPPTA